MLVNHSLNYEKMMTCGILKNRQKKKKQKERKEQKETCFLKLLEPNP